METQIPLYPLFARVNLQVCCKENVLEIFRAEKERYVKTVVSFEKEAENEHLHIFSMTPQSNKKNAKQNLQNFLKQNFPELKNDDRKFAVSKMRTEFSTLGPYTVKEGSFCYYGFSDQEIQEFVEQSFPKPRQESRTVSAKILIKNLQEEYLNNPDAKMTEFISKHNQIKLDHNITSSFYANEKYFIMLMAKKNPEFKQYIDDNYCHTIQRLIDNVEARNQERQTLGYAFHQFNF
jgi:hypothetical protein